MRPPFVEPQPRLHKRKKRDGYDSGPRPKRKRRPPAPEPVETFDDKLAHQAKAAWAWCQEHNREAMALAGGIALVVAAVVWYFVKEAERESQSWLQLSTITREIDQAAMMKRGDASSSNKKDAEEAARKFKRILRDYGDTAATPFVELEWGNTLYEKADYLGARDAYARLAAKHGGTPAGRLGLWGKALSAEQLGEYEEAVAALEQLRKACPEYLTMQVEFDLARCLEAAGRDAEAKPHYAAVLKLTSDDEIRAVAKSRIERIDQGRTDTSEPAKPQTRAATPAKAKSADTATTGSAAKAVEPPGAAPAK